MVKKRMAYLYSRFSHPDQQHGRSEQRQHERALDYCRRHNLTVSEQQFHDAGVSGYRGGNARAGDLHAFLEMVREGRIPEGSVLVIENTDRLSRLPPHEANEIIMAIVNAGVDIATISPEMLYTKQNIRQIGTWIPLQVAQALAHEESLKKGDRMADAWQDKRARVSAARMTTKGPAWLKATTGAKGWEVIERKAAWVRRIFRMAIEGKGVAFIAGELAKQAPEGLTGKGWQPAYIHRLLRSRSVLGEYQPHVGTCAKRGTAATRRPHGEPVKGYFPAIISEDDFILAGQSLGGRRNPRAGGRISGVANLFTSLLRDARDGCTLTMNASKGRKVLVSSGAVRRKPGSVYRVFAYGAFEESVLACLRELTPGDIVAGPASRKDDAVAACSAALTLTNQKMEQLRARAAAEPDVTVFLDLLADLDRQRRAQIEELEQAKAAAAAHGADTLGDAQSLAALLEQADPDERLDLRRKIRARLRQLVAEGWVLVTSAGTARVAAVQLFFREGGRRSYVIALPRGGEPQVRSFADVAGPADLDLRNAEHVRELERTLADMEIPTSAGS